MKKSEKFYEILRNAGITEYWASKDFDPDADDAYGNVLLPTDDKSVMRKVNNLYNGDSDDGYSLFVDYGSKGSDAFNAVIECIEGIERREL